MMFLLLALVIPVGISSFYVHFFIKRLLREFFHIELSKRKNRILHGITLVLSLPAVYVFGLYAISYFHLLIISLVLELVNIGMKRFRLFRYGFASGAISFLIFVAMMCYGFYNINQVKETDYTIASDKISGVKILQITDLHMGNAINQTKLEAYCKEMSRLDADIVVLTGDIVDERTSLEDMKAACERLSHISNKLGIYYVFGNHDPCTYAAHPSFHEQDVQAEFEKHGIQVLKDQVVNLDHITLVGRKDFSQDKKRSSSENLLKDANKENFIIFLDHQPKDIKKNASLGIDLQLSGHTHGGQLFPLREVQNLVTDILVYGERKIGGFTAITSSGISAWGYPLRTEGKSEYVLITIE